MNINFNDLPSFTRLIETMDAHPVGATFFVIALLICSVALGWCLWVYYTHR